MFKSLCFFLLVLLQAPAFAAMNHNGMKMDLEGMVMNDNPDNLPKDCPKLAGEVDITVRAGYKYAKAHNGIAFAFDKQQWDVEPCTRINFTFINDDKIRHQFMVHGLPGYIYPKGMFTIELYGKGEKKASLIVPSKPKTYLVHCEVPQHMEKGMKAQIKVGGGDGDLSSIPGISAQVTPDSYLVDWALSVWGILLVAVGVGIGLTRVFINREG